METKIDTKSSEIKRLAYGIGILFIILGAFTLYLQWPLISGRPLLLQTIPIDPFDLVRGQYITIAYEIATLPKLDGIETGDTVYILMEVDKEGIARYRSASLKEPSSSDSSPFIKGTVKSVWLDKMDLEYGIEQYFFERNSRLPTTNLTVEVKVSNGGRAVISNLLYKGENITLPYGIKTRPPAVKPAPEEAR